MRKLMLALALAVAPAPLFAAVPVYTGVPTDPLSGLILEQSQGLAGQFVWTTSDAINAFEGFFAGFQDYSYNLAGQGVVRFSIARDSGNIPGVTVHTGTALLDMRGRQDWAGLDNLGWAMTPGTYWAVFTVDSGSSFRGFASRYVPNALPNAGYINSSGYHGGGNNPGAFGLRITTAPDGAIGQSSAGPAGGVPEPELWMLMMGGFGLAGSALRRTRAVGQAKASAT